MDISKTIPGGDIARNLDEVRQRAAAAAVASGRPSAAVRLVAVSKTFGAPAVEQAIGLGQRVFGENRVQEAQAKCPPLRAAYPGHRAAPDRAAANQQGARRGGALFDVIETVDRPSSPRALAAEMDEAGPAAALFVEVNTGEEAQKAGVLPRRTPMLSSPLPRRARPAGRGADVHPAGGRGAGAAFRAAARDRAAQRPRHRSAWA